MQTFFTISSSLYRSINGRLGSCNFPFSLNTGSLFVHLQYYGYRAKSFPAEEVPGLSFLYIRIFEAIPNRHYILVIRCQEDAK